MKQLQLHIAILWFVILSTNYAKCKRLRKRPVVNSSRSEKRFHPRRKLDLIYPHRTESYFRFLTGQAARYEPENTVDAHSHAPERFKRGSNSTTGKNRLFRKASHGSALLPQPAKPLRVVATSAVIKNRLKKPRPLKAIHIWGPTPFKTVLENLQKLKVNLQKQRGAVKRLFLPIQLQRKQLLNALANKPPFLGPTGPFIHRFPPFIPERQFPLPPPIHHPDAIHLEEGPPPPPLVPGPIELGPPPLPLPPQPVAPLHEIEPVHLQEKTPVHAFMPPPELASVPADIAPLHELGPAAPYPDMGPPPPMFPANFGLPDIPPNLPPNFEPPPGLQFQQPFPFVAGEVRQEVNRHVHKGT